MGIVAPFIVEFWPLFEELRRLSGQKNFNLGKAYILKKN